MGEAARWVASLSGLIWNHCLALGMEVAVIFLVGILIVIPLIWLSILYERKRTEALAAAAKALGMDFCQETEAVPVLTSIRRLRLFQRGRRRKFSNVLHGDRDGLRLAIFGYQFTTGSGKNQTTHRQTVFAVEAADLDSPAFEVRPEHVFHKIGQLMGYQDIDFPNDPEFSKKYIVRGENEGAVRDFLTPERIQVISRLGKVSVEGEGNRFVMYRARKRIKPETVKEFFDEGIQLYGALRSNEVRR